MDKSVEIDEITDILVSLEFCAFSLTQLHKSERAWKWVIISLHSALQGAMVCHLSGRLLIGFQEEKTAKKSLERFAKYARNEPAELPPVHQPMASAKILLERMINTDKRVEDTLGRVISVTEGQERAFETLYYLRNEFIHFGAKLYCIGIPFMKNATLGSLDILSAIIDDGYIFTQADEDEAEKMRTAVANIKSILDTIEVV